MKYNNKVNEYYKKLDHTGSFEVKDETIGVGLVGSPACGDVMKLEIKAEKQDKKFIIVDAKILVFGCGSAKASSSYAVEMLIGKSLEEALAIKDSQIADKLGLPKIKLHCSVLAESAIKRAVHDFIKKNNLSLDILENNSLESENTTTSFSKEHQNIDKSSNIISTAGFDSFNLEIDESAYKYLLKVLEKNKKPYIGIRIHLEEGNCGFAYKIKYVYEPSDIGNDIVYKHNDLSIFIDRSISSIINNTVMQFKEDDIRAGIIFTNPNEQGKCGCGVNFKLKSTPDSSSCS
jgi:nitrogen fixation NifU-like protein